MEQWVPLTFLLYFFFHLTCTLIKSNCMNVHKWYIVVVLHQLMFCLFPAGGAPLSELPWPSSLAVVAVSISGLFTFIILMLTCVCCKKGRTGFKVLWAPPHTDTHTKAQDVLVGRAQRLYSWPSLPLRVSANGLKKHSLHLLANIQYTRSAAIYTWRILSSRQRWDRPCLWHDGRPAAVQNCLVIDLEPCF